MFPRVPKRVGLSNHATQRLFENEEIEHIIAVIYHLKFNPFYDSPLSSQLRDHSFLSIFFFFQLMF